MPAPLSAGAAPPPPWARVRWNALGHLVLTHHAIRGLEPDGPGVRERVVVVKPAFIDGRRDDDEGAVRLTGPVQGRAFDADADDMMM